MRRQLIGLCGSKRSRSAKFTANAPCDFRPTKVVRPDGSNEPFTEQGAWDFIVQLLMHDQPLQEIILEKPPGKRAYVMLAPGASNQPDIYIKL